MKKFTKKQYKAILAKAVEICITKANNNSYNGMCTYIVDAVDELYFHTHTLDQCTDMADYLIEKLYKYFKPYDSDFNDFWLPLTKSNVDHRTNTLLLLSELL